jgi:dTDP-4-dehydrorhamnose 3,5-epimerase
MKALSIDGAWVYTPHIHTDTRGSFSELFRGAEFAADLGYSLDVAQVNWSVSRLGVIRGLHFAEVPPGQAKYVACVGGALLDVVFDLRVGSPTFGQWEAVRLDEDNRQAVFIEHGLGHAFTALTPVATALYLCSTPYTPAIEHTVHPLDPELGIAWPAGVRPILSDRDAAAPTLAQAARAGLLPSHRACVQAARQLRASARSRPPIRR